MKKSITKEHLHKLRLNQQKDYFGSQAQAMFVDGVFSPHNWNGGDGVIRQYFYDKVNMDTLTDNIDFTYENIHFWGDIIINHTWYEDQNYATIAFAGSFEKDGKLILNEYTYEHVAFLTWYKSRGRTESVKFDGRLMTEDEYLFILNALQETGFTFDLQ